MIQSRKPLKEENGRRKKTKGDKRPQGKESMRQQLLRGIENIKREKGRQERTQGDRRSNIENGRGSSS
ncbi:hypothetical protein FGO68_gene15107 [Halteria grandinella]|uniref:Uncharacterized protein n=1 Tax=Halteria grandinella TaxID=5974 RepID=A0A8J8NE49_HALGN|nr:hypothetical protein FGO68_gene15107 [Halteria grandinella]